MKNTKYTPGPWKLGKATDSIITDPTPDTRADLIEWYGGDVVAETVGRNDRDLISAAPELYESLWSLLEWYDDGVATFEPDCPPELAAIWKKAKEALVKANGGIL